MSPVTEADKSTIAESLDALGIGRIIVVDDDVDEAADSDSLVRIRANIESLTESLTELQRRKPGIGLLDLDGQLRSPEELRECISAAWPDLEDRFRAILLDELPSPSGEGPLHVLAQLVPKDVDFIQQKVADWPNAVDLLFAGGSPKTLVFFDRDLTKAGGTDTGGDELVKELLKRELEGVFCGLLSQEVGDAEAEHRISEDLSAQSKHAVPVLGKFRLASAQDFAVGLAAYVLADDLMAVRSHAIHGVQAAAVAACAAVQGLGYYQMMATARGSQTEGLYEGAGMLRMVHTVIRRETELNLIEKAPTESINRVRSAVATPSVFSENRPLPVDLDDAFESGDHLARCLAPTETGDIYEFTDASGGTREYLLLAQPCDLMVRAKGRRENTDSHFVLARLMRRDKKLGCSGRVIAVPTRPEREGRWVVNLADRVFVHAELLDACALNRDGVSRIPCDVTPDEIPTLAWSQRATELTRWAKSLSGRVKAQVAGLPQKGLGRVEAVVYKAQLGQLFVDDKISLTPQDEGMTVGIKRVQRISESHARGLLLQLAHYHSRPAFPSSLFPMQDPEDASENAETAAECDVANAPSARQEG